jgi:TonB family protein
MESCAALNLFASSTLAIVLVFAGCSGNKPPATGGDEKPVAAADPKPAGDEGSGDEKPAAGGDEGGGDEGSGDEGGGDEGGDEGGDKKTTETRTTEVIQKVILDNRKQVRTCYDKAKKDLPGLEGTLTIHFVLDPEGAVKKAEVNLERSQIKNAELGECAIKELKKMKFPPSSRGMESTINYPFNFKP